MQHPLIIFLFPLTKSTNCPVPIATTCIGFSAVIVSTPVFSSINSSRPRSKAPPPVSTIPLSRISADNSGGVLSSTAITASTICPVASREKLLPSPSKLPSLFLVILSQYSFLALLIPLLPRADRSFQS